MNIAEIISKNFGSGFVSVDTKKEFMNLLKSQTVGTFLETKKDKVRLTIWKNKAGNIIGISTKSEFFYKNIWDIKI